MRTLTLAITLTSLVAGCGEGTPRVPLHPASGTVMVDDVPTAGVVVRLYPEGKGGDLDALKPFATTDDSGSFHLGTYEKRDGAPVGRYAVTLYLPAEPPTGSNSPDDLLGRAYLNPDQTPFRIDITEGSNRLEPFQAKKAAARPRPTPARSAKIDPDGTE